MTDPRIAVLSALSSPGWHPVPEAHGMPWGEAVALLDAYDASRAAAPAAAPSAPSGRAAEWRAAAEHLEQRAVAIADNSDDPAIFVAKARERDAVGWKDAAAELRRMADEAQQSKICELPHLTIAEEDACEQRRLDGEAQQPEARKACGCGQDGCEYCDVDEADEEQPESGACTCAAAGDCFAPAGHYADCPQAEQPAAVSQPGKEPTS